MIRKLSGIGLLLLCGFFPLAIRAHNAISTIQGTVTDIQGAAVPGASVSLTNVGTSQVLHATSKGDGFYSFTNLSPADYKVTATAAGFAQWAGDITLRVSQQAEVNPKLSVASTATEVDVKDATPVI